MRSDYKHWQNTKVPGQTCFVTCTCLDFAHLFKRESMRTEMTLMLLEDCQRYSANLRAFVVMTHHIHLVIQPNHDETISVLMQKIKKNSAKHLLPKLLSSEIDQLQSQDGLNNRKFWKLGFRGNPLVSENVLIQKINYTHENPVRAGTVSHPTDYRWCSARLLEMGLNDEYGFIDLPKSLELFRSGH